MPNMRMICNGKKEEKNFFVNSSGNLGSVRSNFLVVGNRIPKDYFITSGVGESDITVHAGSFHVALKEAGIHRCNIITYSSILPAIAQEVNRPKKLVHGSVLETIMACANSRKGERATAGLIIGWLYGKGSKYGGLVCEYSGNGTEEEARKQLVESLQELHSNGLKKYELRDVKAIIRSFVPVKNFGTALVAICFVNYVYPVV